MLSLSIASGTIRPKLHIQGGLAASSPFGGNVLATRSQMMSNVWLGFDRGVRLQLRNFQLHPR